MMIDLSRRGFIAGLLAAPAIVRIDNIMPVRTPIIMRAPKPMIIPPQRRAWMMTGIRTFGSGAFSLSSSVALQEVFVVDSVDLVAFPEKAEGIELRPGPRESYVDVFNGSINYLDTLHLPFWNRRATGTTPR